MSDSLAQSGCTHKYQPTRFCRLLHVDVAKILDGTMNNSAQLLAFPVSVASGP